MNEYIKGLVNTQLAPVLFILYRGFINIEYFILNIIWFCKGYRKPTKEKIDYVVNNVTFIFKSFERQYMAKRLYKNIQSYYPGVRVIIADDSSKPLDLKGETLTVLQLPFNSGLSYGLNRALEKVETPYVMRMDDDELLTPLTNIHKELKFLESHNEIDLVGFGVLNAPLLENPKKGSYLYYRQSMREAPKPLLIPHLTVIDESHIVVGKSANIFLVRTDKIKSIGWDDHIRMIDHNEFFMRAAGNIVSVLNPNTAVFHYHNHFDKNYQKYRNDLQGDRYYIMMKYSRMK